MLKFTYLSVLLSPVKLAQIKVKKLRQGWGVRDCIDIHVAWEKLKWARVFGRWSACDRVYSWVNEPVWLTINKN